MDAAARQAALLGAIDDLERGEHDRVIDRCARILAIAPGDAGARALLRVAGERGAPGRAAAALQTAGDLRGAAALWSLAIQRSPRSPGPWRALAALQVVVGDRASAERTLRQALGVVGEHVGLLGDLGAVLVRSGDADGAAACTERAVALAPDDLAIAFADLRVMPVLHSDLASVDRWRARYVARLRALAARCDGAYLGQARAALGAVGDAFYAHYACRVDDVELQRIYGGMVHGLVARVRPPLVAPLPARPARARRRVAFVSSMWRSHTIGRLFGGWVGALDRDRFSVELWQLGPADAFTERLAARCDHVRVAPHAVAEDLGHALRERELDAVVFPEVGMDARVVRLAAMRLAPRQGVSWGHPVTTGLPTVDTFLTSAAMEPPGAEAHYTERLLALPGLGICLLEPDRAPGLRDRASFGLAEDDVVLLCTQSVFKLLPHRDRLFADIVRAVPRGRLVLLARDQPVVRATLDARLEAAGIPPDRRLVLPSLDHGDFLDLNTHADVWLDGPDWSGGMTTLEALACGAVPVTLDGPLMRTRHTRAILETLGVTDTIAETPEAWVATAVALGTDPARREALRARLAAALPRLWGDRRGVRALEAWIEGATDAAG